MRDLLLILGFVCAIPTIIIRPHLGVLIWDWLSYMSPHRMTWGYAYDFRFAFFCAIVTLFAWVISKEPKRLPFTPISILIIALLVWTGVTSIFSAQPETAMLRLEKTAKILLMTIVTMVLMQTRERIHALVWVIAISLGFYGLKGALWFASGASGLVWGPPGSFIAGNNELALALVMTIPLMAYLYMVSAIPWVRWGAATVGLFSIASIIGTYSRGAFLAAGAMIFMMIIRSQHRLLFGTVGIAVIAAVVLYAPEQWYERMNTIINYQDNLSAMGRIHTWQFAINLALDHPIVGGGFQAFDNPSLWAMYAPEGAIPRAYHSIYFEMLGDHGFVGLAIFLLLGLAGLSCAKQVIRLTRGRPELTWANNLARMTQVSLYGYAVGGAFLSLAFFDLYYHLLVFAFLVRIVVEREISEQETVSRPITIGGQTQSPIGQYPVSTHREQLKPE